MISNMDLKFGSGGESPKMDHIWNYDTARSCCLLIFVLTTNCNLKQYFFAKILKRVVNKKRTFNVRLLRSYFGPNHKNMRNFYPFFHWNLILWHSKHILSHCGGSHKCSFNALFMVVKLRGLMGILRVYHPLIKNEWKCTLRHTLYTTTLTFSRVKSVSEHIII